MNFAIVTDGLSRRFKRVKAVRDLNLQVPTGAIFAYLGPNGAGKTTTIHLLMNLIRPSGGRAEVLGVDSRKLTPRTLETIGYVSENQKPPHWMTIGAFLDFCKHLYPTWDDTYCDDLRRRFELPLDHKLGHCSRGMRMKAVLVSSLAYRPKLLVLDEPFSGLDPNMRDDMVRASSRWRKRGSGRSLSRPTTWRRSKCWPTTWAFSSKAGCNSPSGSSICARVSGASKSPRAETAGPVTTLPSGCSGSRPTA